MIVEFFVFAALLAIGITMIVTGCIGLARSRKVEAEPEEPWDGEHSLLWCRYAQTFGGSPDDYHSGWVWKCSCGTTNREHYWRLPYTEAGALQEFIVHKRAHIEVLDGL